MSTRNTVIGVFLIWFVALANFDEIKQQIHQYNMEFRHFR